MKRKWENFLDMVRDSFELPSACLIHCSIKSTVSSLLHSINCFDDMLWPWEDNSNNSILKYCFDKHTVNSSVKQPQKICTQHFFLLKFQKDIISKKLHNPRMVISFGFLFHSNVSRNYPNHLLSFIKLTIILFSILWLYLIYLFL